jgi:hypothetical protein
MVISLGITVSLAGATLAYLGDVNAAFLFDRATWSINPTAGTEPRFLPFVLAYRHSTADVLLAVLPFLFALVSMILCRSMLRVTRLHFFSLVGMASVSLVPFVLRDGGDFKGCVSCAGVSLINWLLAILLITIVLAMAIVAKVKAA